MKDYRITIKVRNNRILKAIEEAGGTPGLKWCEANSLSYARVNNLINMTSSPLDASGNLFADAVRLCDVLNKLPEDLWTSEQLYPLERNFSEIEINRNQLESLMLGDGQPPQGLPELPDLSDFERRQKKAIVESALTTLRAREREVLRLRFEDDLTYDSIGERIGVCGHRVRQIEEKALRKLRHPDRVRMLVDCIENDDDRRRAKARALTYKGGINP